MPDPLLVVEDDNPPKQKPNKSIPIEDKTVKLQGKDHIIRDVPKTHMLFIGVT
jgi:hypothetical protein